MGCAVGYVYPLGLFEPAHLGDHDAKRETILQISSVCLFVDGVLDDVLFNIIAVYLIADQGWGNVFLPSVFASLATSIPLLIKRVFSSYIYVVLPFHTRVY